MTSCGFLFFQISEFKLEASTLEDEYDPFAELTDLHDDPAEETRKHSDDEPVIFLGREREDSTVNI